MGEVPLPTNIAAVGQVGLRNESSPNGNNGRFVLDPALREGLLPMALDERLDRVLQAYPDRFAPMTISRVQGLVEFELVNPGKRKPYRRIFREVDDFILYHSLHPEWQGKSTGARQNDKQLGAYAFYTSFSDWVRATTTDPTERKSLVQQIFEPKRRDWATLCTLQDWQDEYDRHPEWQGMSMGQLQDDHKTGASAFYSAFKKWGGKTFQDEEERMRTEDQLLNRRNVRRKNLKTLSDWIVEFQKHPEWQKMSSVEIKNDFISGGGAYYQSFCAWIRRNAMTTEEREVFMRTIFPDYDARRANYKKEGAADITTEEADRVIASFFKR